MITPKFKDRTITVSDESNKVIIKELKNNVVISDSRRSGGDGEISVYVNGANAGRSHDIEFDGHISFKQEDGKVKLTINEPKSAPTLAVHFAGFYETLQDLTDAIPSPSSDLQAIVISPSEKYYHAVANQWVELAPVGSIHADYVGAYASVGDLVSNNPTAPNDSIAIIGAPSDRDWYVKESGQWEKINSQSVPKLTARMDTAEQHLQTLQTQGQGFADDIKQLQDNQFNGIHIEDDDGNSFDDISGLAFDGATVQDDQGTGLSTVVISTKLPIANGQSPDSVSETVKALEFPNAHIVVRDPGGANVGVVTIPNSGGSSDNEVSVVVDGATYSGKSVLEFDHFSAKNVPGNPSRILLTPDAAGGVNVGDGVNASREVKTIKFPGHQAYGSGDEASIHIECLHFASKSDLDSWATKFGSELDYDSIAVVDDDGNGFVGWYKFNAATKKVEEYDAQGVVIGDSNGFVPKNIKTIVLGAGLSAQQAGDQEDAVLINATGSGGSGTININGGKVSDLHFLPPIQTENKGANDFRVFVDPQAFESQHANACLLELDHNVTPQSGKETDLYLSHEIVPTGEYFNLNPSARGVDVQDNTGGDTAVTGGQLTRIMAAVSFYGKAAANGNVKIWIYYKDPSSQLAGGILTGVNGNPMVTERYYKAGDDMSLHPLILANAMMATGQAPIVLKIESTIAVSINSTETLLCIEQFANGYQTSLASIEFQRRIGMEIHAETKTFGLKEASLKDELAGINEPLTNVPANSGDDFLNDFGVQNNTKVMASIVDGVFNISANGEPADYYVDIQIDNVQTQMLRGREVIYSANFKNSNDAYNLEIYAWTGTPDRLPKVWNGWGNALPTINDGYTLIKSKFQQEQPDGLYRDVTDTATIPDNANNIVILVRPIEKVDPSDLSMKDFYWGVPHAVHGYVEVSRNPLDEMHFKFDKGYGEFYLDNQGYQSVRYTINDTPEGNPLPVGVFMKGKAPIERDGTVNTVPGSQIPQFDGAIKFNKDGEARISRTYWVWNEQLTDDTVTFWDVLIDVDGNATKIPQSEATFTAKGNQGASGTFFSIPAYSVEVETGQRVGARASSNIKDGAYIQSNAGGKFATQTVIEFDELVAESSDSPDLVSAPLAKSLVVDRRYHEFTGNSAQNITISNFVIPSDVVLASVTAERMTATGYSSIDEIQHSYNYTTQEMTVHVGGVTSGVVFFEFWSK